MVECKRCGHFAKRCVADRPLLLPCQFPLYVPSLFFLFGVCKEAKYWYMQVDYLGHLINPFFLLNAVVL